ncbi:MAG TPA: urease accessory UreF family protein [Polyangia bacterium]
MIADLPAHRPSWLRLLQLASPTLPIGAFAYSQGLEPAVAAGLVTDEASAAAWILGLLHGPLAGQDLPIFARLHAAHAAGDVAAAERWNAFLLASRPTLELQTEDRHLGAALGRVLATLNVPEPPRAAGQDAAAAPSSPTLASQFARAAASFGIDARTAAETFAFTWAEAQASAAVRLVPLGQSAGVRIVARAAAEIPSAVAAALAAPDDDIAGAAPGLALLSAAHETQYSRLFRS